MLRALTLTCVLLLPAQLLAADARQLFTDGSKALSAGKPDEAVADFEAAYKAKPAPSLLYWLGEAHRAAGHNEQAAAYYKQYIEQLPNGPNRASADAHLAELTSTAAAAPEHVKKKRRHRDAPETATLGLEIPPVPPKPMPPLPDDSRPDPMAIPGEEPRAMSADEARRLAEQRRLARAGGTSVTVQQTPAQPGQDAQTKVTVKQPGAPAAVMVKDTNVPQTVTVKNTQGSTNVTVKDTTPGVAGNPGFLALPDVAPPPPAPTPVRAPVPVPQLKTLAPPPHNLSMPATIQNKALPPPPQPVLLYVTYTARFLAPPAVVMGNYATTVDLGSNGALYTHGFGAGVQWSQFKVGGYFGFGTQYGGGDDTLHRYEISGQFQWVPLGPFAIVSPYVGARVGLGLVEGQLLTNGSVKGAFVLAPQAGVALQFNRYIVLSLGMGYDANLGLSLNDSGSTSGYTFDVGLTLRY